MKLSISNIAWSCEQDIPIYNLMKRYGFEGLEIAPTRIFLKTPYEQLEKATQWKMELFEKYGFYISSMQSIWYGRQEKLFGSEKERNILLRYTKEAINFAEAIGCNNIVFGCPRNRNVPDGATTDVAVSFFNEIGEYAKYHNTVIGFEANPPIYNTNYINTTKEAIELISRVNSRGFLLNLDIGTMLENHERVEDLTDYVHLMNHIHISEPGVKPILYHDLHKELASLLITSDYKGYVSIEMGEQDMDNISILEEKISYVREIFG